MFFQTRPLS